MLVVTSSFYLIAIFPTHIISYLNELQLIFAASLLFHKSWKFEVDDFEISVINQCVMCVSERVWTDEV